MSGMHGKVALVTGGTGGIGSAICARLAKAGCAVISTWMDEAQAANWKQSMAAAGHDVALVRCDVSSFDECKAMGERINAEFGGVDILVNCGGGMHPFPNFSVHQVIPGRLLSSIACFRFT